MLHPKETAPDEEEQALARLVEALANPTRLALLRQLRQPRTLGEIRLRAEHNPEGLNPDRLMTRQAVRGHLDRLVEAGFVRTRRATRGAAPVEEYVVNHQGLFALAEEVRVLGELRPLDPSWDGHTEVLDGRGRASRSQGPRLVVVRGLGEGRAFALDGALEWLIGRRWGLAVTLDYDPFVSSEHARVVTDGGRFFVEALPTSRNPTMLNWVELGRGERSPLATGDVVGVGKSLLLFRG